MNNSSLIQQLNSRNKTERLWAVQELKKLIDIEEIVLPEKQVYTNNHVHTKYSFSPYSPSMAVWMAVNAGLSTVGIMDHDAINGAEEFIEAGKALGIATTIGFEIRTDWSDTPLKGKRINNPDQISNAYISAHGIPHQNIGKAEEFLSRIRTERAKRNLKIVDNINNVVSSTGIHLDYEDDMLPLSYANAGGTVTERHLLFALTKSLIEKYGKGQRLLDMLKSEFSIIPGKKQQEYLSEESNNIYEYDLLNVLKSNFIKDIYVDADSAETVPVKEAVDFITSIDAISSYCYLGDVGDSPTGDKKAKKFEDDYLELVLKTAKDIGFKAIALMPSRNTMPQLKRIMKLCDEYGFMQISGEDINQPRQLFICRQLAEPEFAHLIDTTWALVGHEKAATEDINRRLFVDGNKLTSDELKKRIRV